MSKFQGVDRLILNKEDMAMLLNQTGHFGYLKDKYGMEFLNNQFKLPFNELLIILKDSSNKREFDDILEKIKRREKDEEGREFFEGEIKTLAMKNGITYEEARKALIKSMSSYHPEDCYHVHLVMEEDNDITLTEYPFFNNEYGKPRQIKLSELTTEKTMNAENLAFLTSVQALLYISLLSLEEVSEEFLVKEEKVHTVKKSSSSAKGSKKRSKSPVRLRKVTTKVYTFKEPTEGEKRSYERKTDAWNVRGHWRTYKKSGKRVWIPPYPKGEGVKEGKEYKL